MSRKPPYDPEKTPRVHLSEATQVLGFKDARTTKKRIADGRLRSMLDGRSVFVFTASINRYLGF